LASKKTPRDASRRVAKRKLLEFRSARAVIHEDRREWFLGEELPPHWLGWDHWDEGGDPYGSFDQMKVVLAIEEMLAEANHIRHRFRGTGAIDAEVTVETTHAANLRGPDAAAIADESIVEWAHAVAVDPLSLTRMIRQDPVEIDSLRTLWVKAIGPLFGSTLDLFCRQREVAQWLNCVEFAVLSYPLWVRPLSTWRGRSVRSLLDHLLVLYPVPPVLYVWMLEWLTDHWTLPLYSGAELGRDSMAWPWFVARAQGGSPRRVLQSAGLVLSDALVATVEQAATAWPVGISFRTSDVVMSYAEVVRLGGSIVDFRRLTSVRHFHFHPAFDQRRRSTPTTDRVVPPELFVETIRWVVSQRDRMTDVQAIDVLCWANHEAEEAFRGRLRGQRAARFSWKGRSARSAMASAQRYHAAVHRAEPIRGPLSWGSHGWNWEWTDRSTPFRWQMVELLSSQQLADEGVAQWHCVGTYAQDCAAGQTAIFQLSRDGRRQLTIEVTVTNRLIRQVRGRMNSSASAEDAQVVMRWAKVHGLQAAESAW
jgi:PcfJ-like protein